MYFPVSVRAVLAAGWSRDARRQRGHVLFTSSAPPEPQKQFSHGKPVSVPTRGFPSPGRKEHSPQKRSLCMSAFEARAGVHTQSLGKGSEALGNQVEEREFVRVTEHRFTHGWSERMTALVRLPIPPSLQFNQTPLPQSPWNEINCKASFWLTLINSVWLT